MPKFSVKKPFTILVGVILALVLGVVSVMGMATDLLPTMSLPYLMVMTTYPGASPEKVESDITAPLEAALGTINGVENVASTSAENYSMIVLEFSEETNMDSAMVKATTKLNQLADVLPERAGTPSLMELSADMMATQYVAVSYEGMDIYELSAYVQDKIIPQIERLDGVARVTPVGLVEKSVKVDLNQEKIDEVNDRLLMQVSERLAEAKEKLDDAEAKLKSGQGAINSGKAQLAAGQAQLKAQQANLANQLNDMILSVSEKIPELEQQLVNLEAKINEAAAFLNSLAGRLAELAAQLGQGEVDTFTAMHAAIAQNAPDWYAANSYRLPYSIAEILEDERKLDALIEGLEAARRGLNAIENANAELASQKSKAQAALKEANETISYLSNALEEAKNPPPIINYLIPSSASELEVPAEEVPQEEPPVEEAPPVEEVPQEEPPVVEPPVEEELPPPPETEVIYPEVDEALVAQLEAQLAEAIAVRDEIQVWADEVSAQQPQPLETDPAVLDQIIALLRQAQDFLDLLETADDKLLALSAQLDQLNEYREQLVGALQAIQNNPADVALGEAAAQLIFSGMNAQLAVGQLGLANGEAQLQGGLTQIEAAKAEYEAAREEALAKANLNDLLNMQTLAQLIGAQNFSMPAGYIQDEDGNKFLLKVGDSYESVEELQGAMLCSMEGLGDVRLSDVADVTVTDNADASYAKVDGHQAVLLSIYKGSTASTSDVSDACNEKADTLMKADPNLRLTAIMDQGEYIRLIIKSVMSNLIQGAILAVIVLIFFLKDVRPTLVVAVSIPLSVLVALVAMYFSDISLNMVSLSGLALGIGMLVDNSIVVIENIYRLRSRDIPAARAAVQGTRQVSGAIISSTVTTICVFLPLLFAGGLVRQLMMDMALTITFSLLASLAVAMTVVPCAGSTVLKKSSEKKHPWFDKILKGYEKTLRFCLKVKVVPLLIAIGLMLGCTVQVFRMGLTMIPPISSNEMALEVIVPEGTSGEEAYATADAIMEAALTVDGIQTIGAMSANSAGALMTGGLMGGGSSDAIQGFMFYIVLNEEGAKNQASVQAELEEKTAGFNCTVQISGSSMADTAALTGSGVEVDIYGEDLDTLLSLSNEVADLLSGVPGISDVSNGQEKGDAVVKIVVDKDEAMRLGLTVAQVYGELAKALTTDTTSTTLTAGGESYTVSIIDTTKTPQLEDILRHRFEVQVMNEEGKMEKKVHALGEFARREDGEGVASISRENLARVMKVTSSTEEGYNTALLAREVQKQLDSLSVPDGYTVQLAGESTQVTDMIVQMAGMMALALLLIYLVMVAQFQSLLSPFIVLFTIPLAFTGGLLALIMAGETISMMSLMGFLILMGVVVNNGIVFVDYANQLRIGGLPRREALVATGKTRMRPILMTTMTTVLSMVTMLFSSDPGSEVGKGMAIVIVGGLLYATLMTLYIIPVMYDILFKKKPVEIDIGDEGLDDLPDDAAEFLAQMNAN